MKIFTSYIFNNTAKAILPLVVGLFFNFSNNIFAAATSKLTLANPTTAVGAAYVCASSTTIPIHAFIITANGTSGSGTLTNFQFTTTGDYSAAELINFKIWSNTVDNLGTATLLATNSSPATAGVQSLPAFNQVINFGQTIYFWITIDLSSSITNDHTLAVSASVSTDMTTIKTKAGSALASGIQTFKTLPTTPANPTAGAIACNVTLTATGSAPAGETWWWQGLSCGTSVALGSAPATYAATSAGSFYIRSKNDVSGCWSASCGSAAVPAFLDAPTIVTDPLSTSIGCNATAVSFFVVTTGAGLTYQWQEFIAGWLDISNGGVYSGATTETLTISDPTGFTGRQYRCVVTGTCGAATSTAATLTVLASGLSGVKTIPGNYATLKLAFDDINTNGLIGNLELQITASVVDNTDASLNQWSNCGNNGYTIKIYPTGVGPWTLSGSSATSLITLNGADNVTFNGKLNQTGAANNLILSNTNTAGSTIKFINDATYDTIKYCTLKGVSTTSTTGVVWFSTGTTTGNDYNTITYCDIRDGATTPTTCIFSLGSSSTILNDNNTISYCNIYNHHNVSAGGSTFGLYLQNYNSKWTISNNSLYQNADCSYLTATRTMNSYRGLYIAGSAGDDFNIINNFIGGQSAECGGSAMTYTNSGWVTLWYGMQVDVSNTGKSIMSGNIVKNISSTLVPSSTGTIRWAGFATLGRVDMLNNIVGDNSTGSITIVFNDNSNYTGGHVGIYKLGNGDVKSNTIGSISISGTSNDLSTFYGIYATGSLTNDMLISYNTVGNSSTANSIQFASALTPWMDCYGIAFGTAGTFITTVSNNIISNIAHNGTDICSVAGIRNFATGGTQYIIGNNINNLSTASTYTAELYSAMNGIFSTNTTTSGLVISNNIIHSLSATASVALYNHGIYVRTPTSGTNIIRNNFIHSFSTSSATSNIFGIDINDGVSTISNNMIRLGIDKDGNAMTTTAVIEGIHSASNDGVNFYFNSVYIGGSVAAGAINTYAFRRVTTGVDVSKNNVFYNARSGGTGKHYAITINATNTFTSDYNDIYSATAANTGSYNAGTTPQTWVNWKAGIIAPKDASSMNIDPVYAVPSGTSATVDLHLQASSTIIGKGIAGTGIITDYDAEVRSTGISPNGPCIGADERVIAPGTNAYGIYLPATQATGNILDCEIYAAGGTPGGQGILVGNPTTTNYSNVIISSYQVITEDNIQCTGTNISFTTASGTPDWLMGNGSNPSAGSTTPITSQYSSTGRKDIIENVKVFKDFENMTMPVPSPGTILGAPAGAGCPTTYAYTSSVAGSGGYTYLWSCTPPGGCTADIATPTASTSDITFVNLTGVNQVFVLKLDITTECCGPLTQVLRYITIYPAPLAPTITEVSPQSICTGGAVSWTVSTPDPAYSYDWYTASTSGTLLGSGTTYDIATALTGTTHYYAQATNSYGCSSTRTDIAVTGTDTPAPTVPDNTACGANTVTLSITGPVSEYTYTWYSGSCGGTLLQASSSTEYSTTITASTTIYVNATPPGCATSACSAPTITYSIPPDPIVWQGGTAGANNWFVASNWSSNCLPTCASNVSIPSGTPNSPDIGFNTSGAAASKNIDLQNGATLSFSDSRSELIVCGDFTHAGTITTNNYGIVVFNGSVAQTYDKTNGSGSLNSVTINNTVGATISISGSVDMTLGFTGNLTLTSGLLVTGTNNVIVTNTDIASVSGHSSISYVNGNLRRYVGASGSYDFPVGNATSYQLLNWDASSTSGLTYITTFFDNPADATGTGLPLSSGCAGLDVILDNGSNGGNGGVWYVSPDAGTASYALTLYGTDYSNAQNCQTIVSRPDASSDWSFAGSTFDSQSSSSGIVMAKRTGFTSFSHKAITSSPLSLPINLLAVKATCHDENIIIDWTTSSESNNDYFIIERSKDTYEWCNIGSIKGAGNSNNIKDYSICDNNPFSTTNYYILKQIDFNGKINIMDTIKASCNANILNPENVIAYQVQGQLIEMIIDSPEDEIYEITIYDNLGRIVFLASKTVTKGKNTFNLKIPDISRSTYFLELRNNKNGVVKKIFLY